MMLRVERQYRHQTPINAAAELPPHNHHNHHRQGFPFPLQRPIPAPQRLLPMVVRTYLMHDAFPPASPFPFSYPNLIYSFPRMICLCRIADSTIDAESKCG